MKKPDGIKVEYAHLKQAGLNEKQLAVYSTSDPLTIYLAQDETYSLRGIIDADGWTINDIAECFDELMEDEND